jgi:tRNA(His) 5'-end guanylyltransferase
MVDEMGDRMKGYEQRETGRKFLPYLPVYARLDGRGFSRFTKGMERPYDAAMSDAMTEVTKYLVENSGALTGYCQSDEISLCWKQEDYKSEIFFGGKIQKMVSTLAAMATAKFVAIALKEWPEKCTKALPTFDCRVFQLPNDEELANTFLWRVNDATKNSVSMAASSVSSHKELQGKGRADRLDMLLEKGINWNEYPRFFKEGTFVKRRNFIRAGAVRSKVEAIELGKFKEVEDKARFLLTRNWGLIVWGKEVSQCKLMG